MSKWKLYKYSRRWANWTFGIWFPQTMGSRVYFGIDLGPWEWVFRRDAR